MKRKLIVGFLTLCSIATVCPSVYASTDHYTDSSVTGADSGWSDWDANWQIQPQILQKYPLPLVLMIHSSTLHGTAKKVTATLLLLYILELIKIILKHLKVLPVM